MNTATADAVAAPLPANRPSTGRLAARVAVGVAFTIAVTMGVAIGGLRLNAADQRLMLGLLVGSAAVALAAGALLIRLASGGRWDRLRHRLAVAQGVGVVVALLCVLPTVLVMFLSPHDRNLLIVLLGYSLAVAVIFSTAIAAGIGASLEAIQQGAARMAAGDLAARVAIAGERELSELGLAFNRMAEQLEGSAARQRELEEARQALITAVSHDLRTPVASLRLMVEAIVDGVADDPATIRRYVATMERETINLGRLIDDLFEMAQLDAGQVPVRRVPVPIGTLISQTLDAMAAQAARQQVALATRIEGEPSPVLVDPGLVQRVLYNLVQNAIRHTPARGSVTVVAVGLGSEVRVDVRDTGEGIPAADLPYVFDRFYRGDRARARDPEGGIPAGSGLGLAIARRLVEAHGGRVWVVQPPEGGSIFSFTLPSAPAA